MRSISILAACAVCLFLAGCSSVPAPEPVKWSESAPVIGPGPPLEPEHGRDIGRQPKPVAPDLDAASVGWLKVRTARASGGVYDEGTRYREFSVYEPGGKLIFQCGGHTTRDDFVSLKAGRYVLVTTKNRWLMDSGSKRVQVLVRAGETTYVDLRGES